MTDRAPETLARGYYESIDAGEYERLAGLLATDFTQVRSDRTIAGRDTFVEFMRDGRPNTDTTHVVDETLVSGDGDRVAVRGRLLGSGGGVSFGFVDVFSVVDDRLADLVTYTNRRVETPDGSTRDGS